MNETIPLSDIRIDKEGVWYFRGAEMFRREIVNFFYANLKIDDQGCYLIQLPGDHGDRCRIEVEDTAFVIRSVDAEHAPDNGVKYLSLLLSDDTREALDPETLYTGPDDVLYCAVKSGCFKARFTRSGYYQMAEHIEYDETGDAYFVTLEDRRYYIHNQ